MSNAWEEAKDSATDIFWRGRIAFLGEISWCMTCTGSRYPCMLKWIDAIEGINFQGPKCSWSKDHPYNLVWTKEEYADPATYFTPEIARIVKKARSISSDMYWYRRVNQTENQNGGKNQTENQNGGNESFSRKSIIMYWLGRGCLYTISLLLGFCTLGILLPRDVRFWLVSVGNSFDENEQINLLEDEKESKSRELENIQRLLSAEKKISKEVRQQNEQYQEDIKHYREIIKHYLEDIKSLSSQATQVELEEE